jgi:LytS/YehU family sensor histidine kinase
LPIVSQGANHYRCNSIGNAQCAISNEIKGFLADLMPLALKRRAKLTAPLRGGNSL